MDNFAQVEQFILRTYRPANPDTLLIRPYAYRAKFTGLAAGASDTKEININANGDFVLMQPNYRAWIDDTDSDVSPLITVQLTDTGSSQQLTNDQVDITTYMGHIRTADYAFVYPRIISGRSQVSIQLWNNSTALTYNVEITFVGVQVQQL
jgi:hypothetical protein